MAADADMFTGIVSGIGTLVERRGARFSIACPYKRGSLEEGASIACDGCCLTLVEVRKARGKGAVFAVEASNETLARTTLGALAGRAPHQSRASACARRRARRPSRHRPYRRARQDHRAQARRRKREVRARKARRRLRASSPRRARSRSMASRSRLMKSTARASA